MRRELRRKLDLPLIQLSLSVALKIFQLPAMRSSAPQASASCRGCAWPGYRKANVRSGSNPVILTLGWPLPVCPDIRTFSEPVDWIGAITPSDVTTNIDWSPLIAERKKEDCNPILLY